ncbi:hypothetical protein HanRHA438_Chr16g0781521 [Helianthus annuus]|nr:hypothetical protein HanRHA438_Chr16g0781521 [Helianthus annuus]
MSPPLMFVALTKNSPNKVAEDLCVLIIYCFGLVCLLGLALGYTFTTRTTLFNIKSRPTSGIRALGSISFENQAFWVILRGF